MLIIIRKKPASLLLWSRQARFQPADDASEAWRLTVGGCLSSHTEPSNAFLIRSARSAQAIRNFLPWACVPNLCHRYGAPKDPAAPWCACHCRES